MANLNPRSLTEQKGLRPVIIFNHNSFGQTENWYSVTIIPVSSKKYHKKTHSSMIEIPKNTGGLSEASHALCHQISTTDKRKFINKIGVLPPEKLTEIEDGVLRYLDIKRN